MEEKTEQKHEIYSYIIFFTSITTLIFNAKQFNSLFA